MQGLTVSQKEDMVVGLAVLALHDGGVEVSADNINKLVAASGNSVQSFWGGLFAKILAGRNLDDIIMKPGAGGGPAPAAAAPAAGGAVKAAEVKKVESSSEESVGGAGAGLFGGDEEDW